MCRTIAEYPPNGKRCGRGDHFTPEEKQARRDNYNARRRELYAVKKTEKLSVDSAFRASEKPHITSIGSNITREYVNEAYLEQQQYLIDNQERLENVKGFGKSEDIDVLIHVVTTESSSLQSAVKEEDENFDSMSLNDVKRITLEDGTTAYFKRVRDYADEEVDTELNSFNMYWVYAAQDATNEIAAYKLSQALGEGFSQLVPETTIREFNGRLGTVQAEVLYTPGDTSFNGSQLSDEHLQNLAVFDWIAGSMDRHAGNYIPVIPPREERLIDNGLSFPKGTNPDGFGVNVARFVDFRTLETAGQRPEIIEKLNEFISSPDGLGMKKYLSPESYDGMICRATKLIDGIMNDDVQDFMENNIDHLYIEPFGTEERTEGWFPEKGDWYPRG